MDAAIFESHVDETAATSGLLVNALTIAAELKPWRPSNTRASGGCINRRVQVPSIQTAQAAFSTPRQSAQESVDQDTFRPSFADIQYSLPLSAQSVGLFTMARAVG